MNISKDKGIPLMNLTFFDENDQNNPKRKHTDYEIRKFTDWLKCEAIDCGICDPPMEAQKALDFLKYYLLGENWYTAMPESTQQVNTAIVFDILFRYSRKFRKEWKKYKEKSDVDNG